MNSMMMLGGWIGALAIVFLWVRTIQLCLMYRPWLIPVLLLTDLLVGWLTQIYGFVLWKVATFGLLTVALAYRGLFRTPHWPRVAWLQGRLRQKRRFREPSPWTRGPFTY